MPFRAWSAESEVRQPLLAGWLAGNEEPRDGNEDAEAHRNSQCARRPYLPQQCPSNESTKEERSSSKNLMVSRRNFFSQLEETRIGHKLDPHGRQYN